MHPPDPRSAALADEEEFEIKFVLARARAERVLGRLGTHAYADALHPRGLVSSIYYDTPRWEHIAEKRASERRKAKVRLRWYADLETGAPVGRAFLELKLREGPLRQKVRLETELSAVEVARTPLDAPCLRDLPRRLLEQSGVSTEHVSASLLPAFEVEYARHRFTEVESGARLCVDHHIRVSRANPRRLPPPRRAELAEAVLEVKGARADLPARLSSLSAEGLRRGSFSKYVACFDALFRVAI